MCVVFLPASIAAFCLMHIFWRYRGLQTVGKVDCKQLAKLAQLHVPPLLRAIPGGAGQVRKGLQKTVSQIITCCSYVHFFFMFIAFAVGCVRVLDKAFELL